MSVPIESIVPGAVFLVANHQRVVVSVDTDVRRGRTVTWKYVDGVRRAPKPTGGVVSLRNFASQAKSVTDPKPTYSELEAQISEINIRRERLLATLKEIVEWKMPPSGRFYEDGSPMSYGAAFGSNGERDYVRQKAADAIAADSNRARRRRGVYGGELTSKDKPACPSCGDRNVTPRAGKCIGNNRVWICFNCEQPFLVSGQGIEKKEKARCS